MVIIYHHELTRYIYIICIYHMLESAIIYWTLLQYIYKLLVELLTMYHGIFIVVEGLRVLCTLTNYESKGVSGQIQI